jgi:hypothetical protein
MISLLIAAAALTVDPAEWTYLAKDGDGVAHYISVGEPEDLEDGIRVAWVLQNHADNKLIPYRELKAKVSVDCDKQEITQIYAIAYRANRTTYAEAGATATKIVAPGTAGVLIYNAVCK